LRIDAAKARLIVPSDSIPGLPPPRPIPIKDRSSILFIQRGQLDVIDGAFVVVDAGGVRTVIPVGGIACLMLEPGSRVSHAAVVLAARAGTLLIWVGEAGVRLYAAGQPGGARADRLLYQAKLALDDDARLRVVRRMYAIRFDEEPPARRSVDQLRGIEGARVREMYRLLAQRHGVSWEGRKYDPHAWGAADLPNRCLSAATAALYGLAEAAILAAGYAPAIGFLHTGKPQSFVYDIADLFKFETVAPEAFRVMAAVAADRPLDGIRITDPVAAVRRRCRDAFRRTDLLARLIPAIEDVLAAGGLPVPEAPEEAQPIAIANADASGDIGHRG
jgi:CRISPR-associated protein Cas1